MVTAALTRAYTITQTTRRQAIATELHFVQAELTWTGDPDGRRLLKYRAMRLQRDLNGLCGKKERTR